MCEYALWRVLLNAFAVSAGRENLADPVAQQADAGDFGFDLMRA